MKVISLSSVKKVGNLRWLARCFTLEICRYFCISSSGYLMTKKFEKYQPVEVKSPKHTSARTPCRMLRRMKYEGRVFSSFRNGCVRKNLLIAHIRSKEFSRSYTIWAKNLKKKFNLFSFVKIY